MAEVLGPDERREIDRLRRALTLGEGPELHLIVGDTRRVVDSALAEVLPGVEVPHETVAPEEAPKSFAVRWMRWLEQAIHTGGTQPLVLDAWDVDPEHIEHWGWIFGRLNERRNEIRRGLGRPLLLLVSPDNERLLGRMAPDLWSIRGVGMRLHDRARAEVAISRGYAPVSAIGSNPTAIAEALVDTLTKVTSDTELARIIAQRAGFPLEHLPRFDSAINFWSDVVEQAINGRVDLKALVREAARQLPYNVELRALQAKLANTNTHVPSVLISYSQDSSEHGARVLELGGRLRADGVDVRLDRYVSTPPFEGWSAWTQRQAVEADFVIVVCTAEYRRRFESDGRGPLDTDAVVSLGASLIYGQSARKHGLLPVLLEESSTDHIPLPLRSYTFYKLPGDYHRLYRRITAQRVRPPSLRPAR
jgi:aryl carrier-like protein